MYLGSQGFRSWKWNTLNRPGNPLITDPRLSSSRSAGVLRIRLWPSLLGIRMYFPGSLRCWDNGKFWPDLWVMVDLPASQQCIPFSSPRQRTQEMTTRASQRARPPSFWEGFLEGHSALHPPPSQRSEPTCSSTMGNGDRNKTTPRASPLSNVSGSARPMIGCADCCWSCSGLPIPCSSRGMLRVD